MPKIIGSRGLEEFYLVPFFYIRNHDRWKIVPDI